MDDLVERDGLYYKKFTDVPFTGEVEGKKHQGFVKDGKRVGSWVEYHDNGQLASKGAFENGRKKGPWVKYYKNGQLKTKG